MSREKGSGSPGREGAPRLKARPGREGAPCALASRPGEIPARPAPVTRPVSETRSGTAPCAFAASPQGRGGAFFRSRQKEMISFFCDATINIKGTGSAFVHLDVKLFLFYD